MADRFTKMEAKYNRVPDPTPDNYRGYSGRTCDHCGAKRIDSMHLHHHVCPDEPGHRENYDTDYLERKLLPINEKGQP